MVEIREEFIEGIRVLHTKDSKRTVSISILENFGSMSETEGTSGWAHLLEHHSFNGTTLRPDPSQAFRDASKIGAGLNAFTSQTSTNYTITTDIYNWEEAFGLLLDLVFARTLPDTPLDKEKGIVVEEIKDYNNSARFCLYADADSTMYSFEYGHPILGTIDSVLNATPDGIREFREARSSKSGTTIIVSGPVKLSGVRDVLRKSRGSISALPDNPSKVNGQVVVNKPPRVNSFVREDVSTYTGLRYIPYVATQSEFMVDSALISNILGGMGPASVLVDEVREKNSLCYDIHTYATTDFKDRRLFAVGFSSSHPKLVVDKVDSVLGDIGSYISTDLFLASKNTALSGLYQSFERPNSAGRRVLRQLTEGREVDVDEDKAISEVSSVDYERTLERVRTLLNNDGYWFIQGPELY